MSNRSESPERGGAARRRENGEEDAATMKASEDLKHTTISDKDETHTEDARDSPKDTAESLQSIGTSTADNDEMKDRLASPKKKRVRDDEDMSNEKGRSASNGSAGSDRSEGGEPEKKRPRDEDDVSADKVFTSQTKG